MTDAYICSPLRTPVGGFGGSLRDVPAHELGAAVVKALMERTEIAPEDVDDVLFAQCYPSMEAPALGRVVGLDAGLPETAGGLQLDRRCGSGLQAIIYGCLQVASGGSDLVIVGGAESMSNASFFTHEGRYGAKGQGIMLHDSLTRGRVTAGGKNFPVPGGMIETAENLRKDYAIPREEQDEFAVESHARAVSAQQGGLFREEIVPVTYKTRKGEVTVDTDEHPRPDANLEKLSKLRPIMGRQDPDATVTAGNASGQNDGASAAIVASAAMVAKYGLTPLATLSGWAVAGVAPNRMGIGPVPAVAKLLTRAEMEMKDIDLIELNEAFAAQALACTREWGFQKSDFERMNPLGSGISLGHPVGATGGRILATMLNQMKRSGAKTAIETMCIGGGQGLAALFKAA
ncbi:acetyl-CoA C-acetyltransferase [Albimonas sp. CAU 1670]|uniref:acetyl-CoA C-acetyltransferase n=1 Tax=Albimonas sp. CAU 1670 TaxID=3032599 RepID=UPI0023DA118B|nr:acetyl-CoA C-acetyltransferase [Albimonas sp. CAU 1670]MDF2231993.1 acetyl-CoA C-acetyltransferase [Albimonas sp. CAU 1670]